MQNHFSGNLFISQEYKEFTFTYGGINETIKHTNSATTDFDLTGQIIWPASEALAMYIVDHCESFTGKTILEVGAGAGLTGLVCSHFAKRVLLTDGNDLVVELLKINTEQTHIDRKEKVKALTFDWKNYRQFYQQNCAELDFIIGADVMFWPTSIRPLCQCIKYMTEQQLQKNSKHVRTILALQNRVKTSEDEFDDVLKQNGLQRQSIATIKNIPIWEITKLKIEA